jgi:outer membrane protein
MRPLTLLPALALAALLAPAPASSADLKIGYVDLQKALNDVDEGKTAKAQLKKDFDLKQKKLDEAQEEFKRLKADFDKQAVVMSEDVRRDKQGVLDRKFGEVQGLFVQLQKELSEREREMTRGIFDKMGGIIREIAEAEGFTMVFEKTDAGLLFAPPSFDITDQLVRRYNTRYRPGAGDAKKDTAKKKAEPEKKKEGKK